MKLMVDGYSLSEVRKLINIKEVELIVIGLDFLSFETNFVSMNELEKIIYAIHHKKKLVALDVQRLFHENDFFFIKMLYKNVCFKDIDYFIYSDLGIYQLMAEIGWTNKCIYRAPTYLTNSNDIITFQKFNAYVVASNQISSQELIQISQNIKKDIIIDTFGMGCCFYSKRPLLTNYLKFKGVNSNHYLGKNLKLQEETRLGYYNFIEDQNGTRIYEEKYYALTEELSNLCNVKYLFLHHLNLKSKTYLKIVNLYNAFLNKEISINMLDDELKMLNIEIGKGAYKGKTVLLKGDQVCE